MVCEELRECMKVFIVSIPKVKERRRNMRILNGFEEFFCLHSNLSNNDIISAYGAGLKTGVDFKGLI